MVVGAGSVFGVERVAERAQARFRSAASGEGASAATIAWRSGDDAQARTLTRGDGPAPFPAEARFLTYSLGKTVTAVLVLRQVDQGCLALDVPLARWLPQIPNAATITVRQLLQHTSGLGDYGGTSAYREAVRAGAEPWPFEEFLACARAERLLFAPGTGWAYSNIGYLILRRLLETVGGGSFAELVRQEIALPLGLGRTHVPIRRADLEGLVFGPSRALAGDVRTLYHPGWVATGVVASTAAETAAFYDALFAGRLLPPELLAEMTRATPVTVAPGGRPWWRYGYGLGLEIELDPAHGPRLGHTGAGPGSSAMACHFPALPQPLTVVVFADGEDVAQVEWTAVATAGALAEERPAAGSGY
jgi:D-alanyl-D-alanine carboxypeptidase